MILRRRGIRSSPLILVNAPQRVGSTTSLASSCVLLSLPSFLILLRVRVSVRPRRPWKEAPHAHMFDYNVGFDRDIDRVVGVARVLVVAEGNEHSGAMAARVIHECRNERRVSDGAVVVSQPETTRDDRPPMEYTLPRDERMRVCSRPHDAWMMTLPRGGETGGAHTQNLVKCDRFVGSTVLPYTWRSTPRRPASSVPAVNNLREPVAGQ